VTTHLRHVALGSGDRLLDRRAVGVRSDQRSCFGNPCLVFGDRLSAEWCRQVAHQLSIGCAADSSAAQAASASGLTGARVVRGSTAVGLLTRHRRVGAGLPTGLRCLASPSRCLHSDAGSAHHVCAAPARGASVTSDPANREPSGSPARRGGSRGPARTHPQGEGWRCCGGRRASATARTPARGSRRGLRRRTGRCSQRSVSPVQRSTRQHREERRQRTVVCRQPSTHRRCSSIAVATGWCRPASAFARTQHRSQRRVVTARSAAAAGSHGRRGVGSA
jgi:hypothetical protein